MQFDLIVSGVCDVVKSTMPITLDISVHGNLLQLVGEIHMIHPQAVDYQQHIFDDAALTIQQGVSGLFVMQVYVDPAQTLRDLVILEKLLRRIKPGHCAGLHDLLIYSHIKYGFLC